MNPVHRGIVRDSLAPLAAALQKKSASLIVTEIFHGAGQFTDMLNECSVPLRGANTFEIDNRFVALYAHKKTMAGYEDVHVGSTHGDVMSIDMKQLQALAPLYH